MCQKWEGDFALWVLNEIILKKYAESLIKIVGAIWELPAKGQIISECPYEIIVCPKIATKKFPRFLP